MKLNLNIWTVTRLTVGICATTSMISLAQANAGNTTAGVSNAIVEPDLFERFRLLIIEESFLLIEGEVQNSQGVVLIKARKLNPLSHEQLVGSESHDFH